MQDSLNRQVFAFGPRMNFRPVAKAEAELISRVSKYNIL